MKQTVINLDIYIAADQPMHCTKNSWSIRKSGRFDLYTKAGKSDFM